MRTTYVLLLVAFAVGCTRNERESAPPSPTAKPAIAPASPPPPVAAAATPAVDAAASPGAADDFEWDLANEAEGPEFEIDAAATAYFHPAPAIISFKAKALNGTPPFKFVWDFGDGSPQETGETVTHTYPSVGLTTIRVTGTEAGGEKSIVTLMIRTVTPEEFADRMHLGPEFLKQFPSPAPTP